MNKDSLTRIHNLSTQHFGNAINQLRTSLSFILLCFYFYISQHVHLKSIDEAAVTLPPANRKPRILDAITNTTAVTVTSVRKHSNIISNIDIPLDRTVCSV